MNLKRLLKLGYFPKELPPPFNTESFATKSRYINSKWSAILNQAEQQMPHENPSDAQRRFAINYGQKYASSKLLEYSISKNIYSRRKIEIPNPKQFLDLSNLITDNWNAIKDVYKISDYSLSYPVLHNAKRAVRTKSKSWNNFKFELIEKSYKHKFELRLDIANFYPTIYTHTIPWALLGKSVAKDYFKIKRFRRAHWNSIVATDRNAQLYLLGDEIDTLIRNCNERQSIGIPIGPDTSFLVGELIGCRIDQEIKAKLVDIPHSCIRYYDDYYFYLNSVDEAETVLKIVQKVLYEFRLETNENKIEINKIPFKYVDDWSLTIVNFKFKRIDKYELKNYFATIFSILNSNKNKSSWIIHYALSKFEYGNVKIKKNDWQLFLSFLLQTLLVNPSTINQIFKIVLSYEYYVNAKSKEKISNVLQSIIKEHLTLNHSYEVSWCLWFMKSFKIKCPSNLLSEILKSNDDISKIICLDLINSNLYSGRKPGLTRLTQSINSQSLFNENWLLAYESYIKSWLNFRSRNILNDNEFFEVLNYYDVSFYNEDNQIKTEFEIRPRPTRIVDPFDDDFELEDWQIDILMDEAEERDEEQEEESSQY